MTRILSSDRDWRFIEGEPCRVIEFSPIGRVENLRVDEQTYIRTGQAIPAGDVIGVRGMPYAYVSFECPKLPAKSEGAITHKLDFLHLWVAFKDRGIGEEEEVIVFWTKKPLRGLMKALAVFMPRLAVMVFKKGAYESMTDPNGPQYQPPVEEWRPVIWG